MRFVDIHTHLIPELDDGSASLLESLEMLRYAHEHGTRAMVATPHMFASFGNVAPLAVYDSFVAMVRRLERMETGDGNGFLKEMALYLGSENFVSPARLRRGWPRDQRWKPKIGCGPHLRTRVRATDRPGAPATALTGAI